MHYRALRASVDPPRMRSGLTAAGGGAWLEEVAGVWLGRVFSLLSASPLLCFLATMACARPSATMLLPWSS